MAIRVVEFSSGGTKLQRVLHKNQRTQRKSLNFEFWINGELSKIGHHFNKKRLKVNPRPRVSCLKIRLRPCQDHD